MLEILNYKTSEKDTKRLDYAINQFGRKDTIMKRSKTLVGPADSFVSSDLDMDHDNDMKSKVADFSKGLP